MSALSAAMLIRRCIGGLSSSSAFVGQTTKVSNRHLGYHRFGPGAGHIHRKPFISSRKAWATQNTSILMSTTAPHTDTSSSLVGIDWVRSSIVTALNDVFDPVEIAKGAAIAKLDNKKKKKKKKKNAEDAQEEEPAMSPEEREAIISTAGENAKPFSQKDTMVTPATKPEFGDYQCNAAMSLAKSAGLNPRECASKIVESLKQIEGFDDIIEEPEIAGPGFINLKFKDVYLSDAARNMALDSSGRLAVPTTSYVQRIFLCL